MIKGEATIQFGSGSVVSVSGIHKETGIGAVFMRTCEPGKIGINIRNDVDPNLVAGAPEVVMYFTSIESLDVQIYELTNLRQRMIEFKKEE